MSDFHETRKRVQKKSEVNLSLGKAKSIVYIRA